MDSEGTRLFEAALELLEERRFVEAVDAFSELVILSPEMIGAYGNRGLAYLNLGLDEEARNDFETVLQLDPEDAMGHSMLAEVGRFVDEPEVTLERICQALELNPDEPQAHFIRGWLFAKAGQYEAAAEDLTRFLEIAGDNEDIADFRDACLLLSGEDPKDESDMRLNTPEKADAYLGGRGWSYNYSKNAEYEDQGLPCPYAHCIRNRPPLSPETPEGCPVFGYSCPGHREQVRWCRDHPGMFE